jgi:hypothetical protein
VMADSPSMRELEAAARAGKVIVRCNHRWLF